MMWKEKYKIGVDVIDKQHQELFKRVSEFLHAIQKKDQWENKMVKVKETLDFMKEYVIVHFADEEEYQEKIGYPYLEEHRDAHNKFKAGVFDYVDRFEREGFTEELVQEFGGKLMTWLIMHVAKMDQEIGNYVKSKGGENFES